MKMLAKAPEERYQIPLLLVSPLRHFCAGTTALLGGLIRPPTSLNLARPPTGINLARPSTALNLARPPSNLSLDSERNGHNGQNGDGHR